jgi:hypothetical protein
VQEVRLVDERETTLLRLDRRGLAPDWLDTAVRLKGTMLAVATGIDVAALDDPVARRRARDRGARRSTRRCHRRRGRPSTEAAAVF